MPVTQGERVLPVAGEGVISAGNSCGSDVLVQGRLPQCALLHNQCRPIVWAPTVSVFEEMRHCLVKSVRTLYIAASLHSVAAHHQGSYS